MASVELIYDRDCPNVAQARENLLRALCASGFPLRWREWDRARADTPSDARACGSPTIRINRKDVAGAADADAACCRLYLDERGVRQGAPPVSLIVAALAGTSAAGNVKGGAASLLPAVGTALMPKLVCPACWPAYTGLLGALGFGFVNYTPLLLPLTAVFLVIVLIMLAWRAKRRHGYAPLALGVAAASAVLAGKFLYESDPVIYTGIALLVAASLWNAWPRRRAPAPCPACVTDSDSTPDSKPEGGAS